MTKTIAKTWLSGFCGVGLPADSHTRCRVVAGGLVCSCICHQAPVVETVTPTGVLVTDAAPDTAAWFAARRGGITGTDLPKILGDTKYGNALSVWMDKRGELDDDVGEAAEWGHLLEDPVAQEWARRHDTSVRRVGVIANVERPWVRASLDRLVDQCPDGDGPCGLEVKTRSAFKADDYRGGVPDDVLAQVEWGLLTTGLSHMHVAVLIGGQRMESLRVDRDELVEAYLLDAAAPVWAAVGDGVPPEAHPDSDGVLLDLLNRIYEKRAGERDLPPDADRWLDQYAEGSDLAKRGEAMKTEAKTALVQMLDDGDTGLLEDRIAFTYKRPEPGVALPAGQMTRLRAEKPDTYQALVDEGFITPTNPGPRFDLKKRPKNEESAA